MGRIWLQTPPGLRKSGMPDSVEIPAPVKTTARRAPAISLVNCPTEDIVPEIGGDEGSSARAKRSRRAAAPNLIRGRISISYWPVSLERTINDPTRALALRRYRQ